MAPRSEIREYKPTIPGFGTSRLWSRNIQGRQYSFTAVLMPDGERRYFVTQLKEGKDGRFASSWRPVLGWVFKP